MIDIEKLHRGIVFTEENVWEYDGSKYHYLENAYHDYTRDLLGAVSELETTRDLTGIQQEEIRILQEAVARQGEELVVLRRALREKDGLGMYDEWRVRWRNGWTKVNISTK